MSPNIKSGNYLNNIMALLPKDSSKYQDSYMLDHQGYVTEGTTFNIFFIKEGVIYTSPDQADILHGITRDIVFYCADKLNIKVKKEFFKPKSIQQADEAFATSSTKEIVPITKIDQYAIGSGKLGGVTKKLMQEYKTYIEEYIITAKQKHPWSGNV